MAFESIKNKRVLVTGASGGIGSCIAELFAKHGASVGLHYRSNRSAALALAKKIRKKNGTVETFQADLLESGTAISLIDAFATKFDGIDILINNAGATYDYRYFSDLPEQSWQNTFDLNVKAAFYLSGAAFQHMKASRRGKMINMSSANVKYGGSAKSLHYCAAKAALDSLTIGFAREGARYNILVNSIRCGVIDTPMRKKITGYSEEQFQKRVRLIPLQHTGKPVDIAMMALYLASEYGDFITGEIITIAGGD